MISVLKSTCLINETHSTITRTAKLYWDKGRGFQAELYQEESTDISSICIKVNRMGHIEEKLAEKKFKAQCRRWVKEYQ